MDSSADTRRQSSGLDENAPRSNGGEEIIRNKRRRCSFVFTQAFFDLIFIVSRYS
jgi:hypothetical protein